MSNIAFLGLGAMGGRMAARLIAAGHAVTVWNRSAPATQALVAQGARAAATPKAAAQHAEVVISMLTDDTAARAVWLDAQTGAAQGLRPGALAIESSTVTPAWIDALHSAVSRAEASLIDAPVVGSRPQAQAGQLVFVVGGSEDTFARARPVLAAMGAAAHRAGPLGHGAQLKLVVNTLFATQAAVLGELLRYVRQSGMDATAAAGILSALPVLSPAAAGALRGMLAQDYAPLFPIDLVVKDLGYALAAARAAGAALPITDAVRARFAAAQAHGLGEKNITAIALQTD